MEFTDSFLQELADRNDIVDVVGSYVPLTYKGGSYWACCPFHNFMYDAVYRNPTAKGEESKVKGILTGIFEYYVAHPDRLPAEFAEIAHADGLERAVCDYVAGMTDGYAMERYGEIFIPAAWSVK